MHKTNQFIKYFFSKCFGTKNEYQVAQFDTINLTSIFMSDLMFSPLELKHW